MRCTCSRELDPCPSCTLRIDDAEGRDRFFDTFDEGYAVMPGGDPW